MTEEYYPDILRERRLDEHRAKMKTAVTVDKPIRFRVGRVRPATHRKHYRRKPSTQPQYDPRKVEFY